MDIYIYIYIYIYMATMRRLVKLWSPHTVVCVCVCVSHI